MREWMFGYYGNEKKKKFGSCYEHRHAKGMGCSTTRDRFCRIYSDEQCNEKYSFPVSGYMNCTQQGVSVWIFLHGK